MAFRFQLTYGSFLLMPRGPTAAALLPSNIKLCFRRPRFPFLQGRFSSSLFFACSTWRACLSFSLVSPSTISHGGGRFVLYIFLCSLLDAISGTIFCFLYHISLLSLINMLLSRLFRMGGSDYLDDNPMKKYFSGKEKSIFSFILRWKERF